MEMILSPKCLCSASKLLVVQWHLQTVDRILEEKEDRKYLSYLNASNGQSSCSKFRDDIA